MQMWEYKTLTPLKSQVKGEVESERPRLVEDLERESKEGWEAVGLAVIEEVVLVLLKRPRQ